MNQPVVSISCITYNHAPYLRDALDSFLMQRDVPFEILIHDDASTDGTEEIIREYTAKFPQIIRPLYEKENQYSKGISNISGVFNYPRARGRYIAMCEGDDFWTDPNKLREQVEYMDYHPECSLCCHSAENLDLGGSYKTTNLIRPYEETKVLTPGEVISHNVIIPSASMMFLTEAAKRLPKWYYDCPVGDAPLHLFMLLCGDVFYMDKPMSVYRTGRPGSWTVTMDGAEDRTAKWEKYYDDMIKLYTAFNDDAGGRFTEETAEALGRIRFFTDINEGKDSVILLPENKKYLSELPKKEADLLRLRAKMPGVYDSLRKVYKKITK